MQNAPVVEHDHASYVNSQVTENFGRGKFNFLGSRYRTCFDRDVDGHFLAGLMERLQCRVEARHHAVGHLQGGRALRVVEDQLNG